MSTTTQKYPHPNDIPLHSDYNEQAQHFKAGTFNRLFANMIAKRKLIGLLVMENNGNAGIACIIMPEGGILAIPFVDSLPPNDSNPNDKDAMKGIEHGNNDPLGLLLDELNREGQKNMFCVINNAFAFVALGTYDKIVSYLDRIKQHVEVM